MGMLLRRHHKNNKGVAEKVAPNVVEETVVENKSVDLKFTKTEINRKPTSELKEIAKSVGIEDADKLTGSELKKLLIEKLV